MSPCCCADGNANKLTIAGFSLNASKMWNGKKKGAKITTHLWTSGKAGLKYIAWKKKCLCYLTIARVSWSPELLWAGAPWVQPKLIPKLPPGNSSYNSSGKRAHFYPWWGTASLLCRGLVWKEREPWFCLPPPTPWPCTPGEQENYKIALCSTWACF